MSGTETKEPAGFMYLNPDTCLRNSVHSVAGAQSYLDGLDAVALSNAIDRLPEGSEDIDARVFLADAGLTADVSGLNAAVMEQELLEGLSADQQADNMTFVSNVLAKLSRVSGSGDAVFAYEYFIGPNSVREGDAVLLVVNEIDRVEATVDSIDYDNRRVGFDKALEGEDFRLVGIAVSDPRRIAAVNLVRGVAAASEVDQAFNRELYSLLYPETRWYGDGLAFEDYRSRAAVQDFRIGKNTDFLTNREGFVWPYQDVRDLVVHDTADFRGPVRFRSIVEFEAEPQTLSDAHYNQLLQLVHDLTDRVAQLENAASSSS